MSENTLVGIAPLVGVFCVAVIIYFIPSMAGNEKKHSAGIFCLNLFLGWTLIGWVIALVWAVSDEKASAAVPAQKTLAHEIGGQRTLTQKLDELDGLLKAGRITQAEHERLKERVILQHGVQTSAKLSG